MQEALKIVAAGLGGVFVGMTLLYFAIRITSAVADRMAPGGDNER
jgi:Na+-transporting methylmalonyl-CoA/oxaloacetate decarboxylase gamma subunit